MKILRTLKKKRERHREICSIVQVNNRIPRVIFSDFQSVALVMHRPVEIPITDKMT